MRNACEMQKINQPPAQQRASIHWKKAKKKSKDIIDFAKELKRSVEVEKVKIE